MGSVSSQRGKGGSLFCTLFRWSRSISGSIRRNRAQGFQNNAHSPGTGRTMTRFDIVTASLEPVVTLIEASAGTGKTYSITVLILRLILEQHLSIMTILDVT